MYHPPALTATSTTSSAALIHVELPPLAGSGAIVSARSTGLALGLRPGTLAGGGGPPRRGAGAAAAAARMGPLRDGSHVTDDVLLAAGTPSTVPRPAARSRSRTIS